MRLLRRCVSSVPRQQASKAFASFSRKRRPCLLSRRSVVRLVHQPGTAPRNAPFRTGAAQSANKGKLRGRSATQDTGDARSPGDEGRQRRRQDGHRRHRERRKPPGAEIHAGNRQQKNAAEWAQRIDQAIAEAGNSQAIPNEVLEAHFDVSKKIRQKAPDATTRDLGIVAAGQLALHYWIAAFGTMANYAANLNLTQTAQNMKQVGRRSKGSRPEAHCAGREAAGGVRQAVLFRKGTEQLLSLSRSRC